MRACAALQCWSQGRDESCTWLGKLSYCRSCCTASNSMPAWEVPLFLLQLPLGKHSKEQHRILEDNRSRSTAMLMGAHIKRRGTRMSSWERHVLMLLVFISKPRTAVHNTHTLKGSEWQVSPSWVARSAMRVSSLSSQASTFTCSQGTLCSSTPA